MSATRPFGESLVKNKLVVVEVAVVKYVFRSVIESLHGRFLKTASHEFSGRMVLLSCFLIDDVVVVVVTTKDITSSLIERNITNTTVCVNIDNFILIHCQYYSYIRYTQGILLLDEFNGCCYQYEHAING
jgi:hypothetical protein